MQLFKKFSGWTGKLPFIYSFDGWRTLSLGATALSLLLLLAIWTSVLQSLENEKHLVIENARAVQHNLSVTTSENLNQLIDRGKLLSIFGAQLIENKHDAIAQTRMTALLGTDQAFSRMVVFAQNGEIAFASAPMKPDVALKSVIRQVLNPGEPNRNTGMVFGPKPKTLLDAWHMPLLYPIINRNGKRSGALMLVLDLGYLLQLNQNMDMGVSEVINILTDDGQEIVRASSAGLEFGGTALIYPNTDAPLIKAHFAEPAPLFQDKIPRLVNYHHSDRHPFATLVSQEADSVLKGFEDKKKDVFLLVSFLTLAVIISLMLIRFAIKRKQRAFMELSASEKEKQELITKLHYERQRAVDLAATDHLTGLCNRRQFIELASKYLFQAKRNRLHYSVFFIDLDRFKAINDSLGHHVGDLLLQTVASRLQATLRESDLIARFGGDEFVLMLTGLESEEDITRVAEKVVEAVSQPCLDLAGNNLQIYPSIGISIFPRDGEDMDTILRNADLAMYQSKQSKNRSFTFFDASLNVGNVIEFDLEQRFPYALKNDEFVLHFQPKVELSTYRIVGLEALVRWQHPEHGLIFPGAFIELAENSGHIVELGNWVVEAACKQLAQWKAAVVPIVPVAFNVSALQLQNHALANHIVECLSKHGLDSHCLQIEVTESCLVENLDTAGAILDHLVEAGMHISLDDFGTGFSSLGYIKNLPIDTIKIDRSFISNIRNSHDDTVIVTSTITLAHNLGMRVVAEGVETSEQLVYLRASGCDEIQGYYFSRPLPDVEIRKLLIQERLTP